MKKTFVMIMALCVVGLLVGNVLAGTASTVLGNRRDRIISELQQEWNDLVNGTDTLASLSVVGEVTIDGKYAVTGSDATTGLMIQTGTTTGNVTLVFSPVFGGTPRVVGNYSEDAGADAVIEFTSTTPTSTVVINTAAKDIDWIAIGARP